MLQCIVKKLTIVYSKYLVLDKGIFEIIIWLKIIARLVLMVVLYPVFCWSYIRKFLIATGFRKWSYRKWLSLVIFLFHYQTWIVSFPTQYVYETPPWSVLLNQSWCIIKTSINNCCHITQTITFFPRKKIKLMSCIAYSWKWKIYYTSLVIGFRANHFIFISIL